VASEQSVIETIRNLYEKSQAGSVAAFSEDVRTSDTFAKDFAVKINGVTLRFKNHEVQNKTALKIDLFTYAIPLMKALAVATKEETQRLLQRFDLKENRGEVSVGLNFLLALSRIYAEHKGELASLASA
jgi:hypothetical protein